MPEHTHGSKTRKASQIRMRRFLPRLRFGMSVCWAMVVVLCLEVHSQGIPPPGASSRYVGRGSLRPQLRQALQVLGDRLERPGKERLTLIGTLSRSGGQPVSIRLVWEWPGRLRFEEAGNVITFDGSQARKRNGTIDLQDEDLTETFVYDSVEHFFLGQIEGLATRFLGSHFRLDDGRNPSYSGPFYEIYQITDLIRMGPKLRQQPKVYYFNSVTQLLERVRYKVQRDRAQISVGVDLTNWGEVQGQRLPGRVVRLENGAAALSLTITAASLSPRVDDGIFGNP